MRRLLSIGILLGLLLGSSPLAAKNRANVEATVEPSVATVGDTVEFRLEVRVEGRSAIAIDGRPRFGDTFRVLGRTNSPRTILQGNTIRRTRILTYKLRALETGTHEIDPPSVRIGGNDRTPKAPQIRIVDRRSGSGPNAPGTEPDDDSRSRSPSDVPQGELGLVARVDPTRKPYLGQQITLSYRLLADPHRHSVNPRAPDMPTLDAFWIENLSRKVAGQTQMKNIGGRLMRSTMLRAFALFPLETGEIRIDPMTVDVELGGIVQNQGVETVESGAVTIDVQPLPPGAPDGFYEGNVGRWSFRLEPQSRTARRGGAVTLRMIVDGEGNVGRLRLPALTDLDGFEVSNRDEEVEKSVKASGIRGRKVVTATLVPKRRGQLEIPQLEFSYFDPDAGAYRTVASDPVTIHVKKGTGRRGSAAASKSSSDDNSRAAEAENPREALIDQLDGPMVEPHGSPPYALDGRESTVLAVAAALPALGLVVLLLAPALARRLEALRGDRDRRDRVEQSRRVFRRAADGRDETGTDAVRAAWKQYLRQTLEIPGGRLSPEDVREPLLERGYDGELADEIAAILEICERSEFGPTAGDGDDVGDLGDRSLRALEALESNRASNGIEATSATGMVLLGTAALVATVAPGSGLASDGDGEQSSPEQIVELQRQGNWERAAAAWRGRLSRGKTSTAAHYNLGTALAHTGDTGPARLHLERAAHRAPGDPRIQNNLAVVRDLAALARGSRGGSAATAGAPPDWLWWWDVALATDLRPILWGGILALWLLCLGCAGRRYLRGTLRFAATTGAAVGLAGLLAAGAAWTMTAYARASTRPLVVTADELVRPRTGPSSHAAKAPTRLAAAPGTMLPLVERRGRWLRARTATGERVWFRRDDARPVVPR